MRVWFHLTEAKCWPDNAAQFECKRQSKNTRMSLRTRLRPMCMEDTHMKKPKAPAAVAVIILGLTVVALARVSPPQAPPEETISGTISATRIITQNARLVGDVSCTVQAAPCIQFGAPNIKLNLSGFTITGLGDPSTGCQGNSAPPASVPGFPEVGVIANGQSDLTIQGPGLVQRFRASGIFLTNNSRVLVTQVTASTNCNSGILVTSSSDNRFEANVSVRNGTTMIPCGGL